MNYFTKEELVKIALEYPSKGGKALARELGRTVSSIGSAVKNMRKVGIRIPIARNTVIYHEAAAEIRKLRPELVK